MSHWPKRTWAWRRQRLTNGISTDRTSKPNGTIQNPTRGRNPKNPKKTRRMPIAIRSMRFFGRSIVRLPSLIFAMASQIEGADTTYKGRSRGKAFARQYPLWYMHCSDPR